MLFETIFAKQCFIIMTINYSIIIPHKNIPQLLERCLQSIPMREDIQIIVVDDNSNPNIVDFNHFPSRYYKNIEIYYSKEGKGAGYARNIGLKHAKGKWIIFADADDFFTEDFKDILDIYIKSIYEVILFPVKIIDSESLKEAPLRDCFINETITSTTHNNQEKLAKVVTPHSKLIKKEFIRTKNISFEEIPYSNDVMFGAQIAILASITYVDIQHIPYALTFRLGSLTTSKGLEAFKCRLKTSIRCNLYYKKKSHPELMIQLNKHYLSWAAQLGKKEVLYTTWELFKNGFLFYKEPHSWNYKYYNSGWYHLYKAIVKSFFHKG